MNGPLVIALIILLIAFLLFGLVKWIWIILILIVLAIIF